MIFYSLIKLYKLNNSNVNSCNFLFIESIVERSFVNFTSLLAISLSFIEIISLRDLILISRFLFFSSWSSLWL